MNSPQTVDPGIAQVRGVDPNTDAVVPLALVNDSAGDDFAEFPQILTDQVHHLKKLDPHQDQY